MLVSGQNGPKFGIKVGVRRLATHAIAKGAIRHLSVEPSGGLGTRTVKVGIKGPTLLSSA
jgi:hypothetical protein